MVFRKGGAPETFVKLTGKHLRGSMRLQTSGLKLQTSDLQPFKIENPTQLFSYEVCETLKNSFFTEHLRGTASEISCAYLKVFYQWSAFKNVF